MRINETDFEYHIDYINKKMHLIDLHSHLSGNSLANVLDPGFQKLLMKREALLTDVLDFDWIVYASNGMVANFKGYNFSIISPKLPYLHEPFLKRMQERRKGLN